MHLTLDTSTQNWIGKTFLPLFAYRKKLNCAGTVLSNFHIFSLSALFYGVVFMFYSHQDIT